MDSVLFAKWTSCPANSDSGDEAAWLHQGGEAIGLLSEALISQKFSTTEIAERVLRCARTLTDSEHGFVSAMNPKTGEALGLAFIGPMDPCLDSAETRKRIFPKAADGSYQGLWGHALNTGKPCLTNHLPEDPYTAEMAPEPGARRNLMAVPVTSDGQLLGLIALERDYGNYEPRHVEAIDRLARLYGAALQRKRADQALREQQRFSEKMANTTQAIMLMLDPAGRILWFNKFMERVSGYTCHEVKGLDWFETFVLAQDKGHVHDLFENAIRDGTTAGNVNAIRCKDGTARLIKWYDSKVVDDEGTLTSLLAIGHDVTETREAEETIRKGLARARALFSISQLALSDKPLDEVMDCALQAVLEMGESMLPKRGMIFLMDDGGKSLRLAASRGRADMASARCITVPLGTCLCGKVAATGEAILAPCMSDTHEITCDDMLPHGHCCLPILKGSDVLGVLNLYTTESYRPDEDDRQFLDTVTQTIAGLISRKKGEDLLRKMVDELSRLNSELERFAVIAAHDLQEPVRNVILYAQRLQRKLSGRLNDEENEYFSYLTGGAQRILAMVGALLSYTQISLHERAFHTVDLSETAKLARINLKHAVARTGTEITIAGLPKVMGEQNQLVLVFQHLIGNAIKYGTPNLRPRVDIRCRKDGTEWVFSVKDNGIGIEPQYFEQIFGVFKRLHTIAAYPGTGIGLPICQRIIERHGGRIWVESEPGIGSTFHFTLPAMA